MAAGPAKHRLRRVLAIVAVIGCLAGLAAWRYWPWQEKHVVTLPPPAASPGQVAVAYLRALDAYDSATANALSAPSERSTTGSWLSSTASVTGIKIDSVQHYVFGAVRYQACMDFRYSTHWWMQDPSFPDGEHYWCYDLVHSHGRWLIADDGTG
jgi:hypothetical protein